MNSRELNSLVRTGEGVVSRKIFWSQDIYRLELERIFTRCWLYLGHESQIKSPGDYFTAYMGEDPIIVWRDQHHKVRAFLNSCAHRGMKVCRVDSGSAHSLSCSFHGWTYNSSGELVGVPFHREVYYGELDRRRWGLREVNKVTSYGGLIFGCWDAGAISLDDYLGDLRFYLDIVIERPLGGLDVAPGLQRYKLPVNWKIQAENFAGDTYHVATTHAWTAKLGLRPIGLEIPPGSFLERKAYALAFDHGHGILEMMFDSEAYEADLAAAKRFGPEAVDYVRACRDRLERRLSSKHAAVYSWGVGNIFPAFAIQNFQALRPVEFYIWQPRGPDRIDVWQWCALDRDAPAVVKQQASRYFLRHQSAAGLFGEDDTDNFEQLTTATKGVIAQSTLSNYQMGLGHESLPHPAGYPGNFGLRMSEHCQREFYSYWSKCMTD